MKRKFSFRSFLICSLHFHKILNFMKGEKQHVQLIVFIYRFTIAYMTYTCTYLFTYKNNAD